MDLSDYHLKYSKEWKCNLPIARACIRNDCTKCPYREKREMVTERLLTRMERAQIMQLSGKYLKYRTYLNRGDFTLWETVKAGGKDRVYIDQKIVSNVVR